MVMTMTNEALAQLAKDVHMGKVFGTWMMTESEMKHSLHVVFMCLALMEDKAITDLLDRGCVHFYEYYDQQRISRSINGMPIFFSMHYLTREDSDKLQKALKRLDDLEEATKKSVIEAIDE